MQLINIVVQNTSNLEFLEALTQDLDYARCRKHTSFYLFIPPSTTQLILNNKVRFATKNDHTRKNLRHQDAYPIAPTSVVS